MNLARRFCGVSEVCLASSFFTLTVASCVALGKLIRYSESYFPHLEWQLQPHSFLNSPSALLASFFSTVLPTLY